MTKEQAAELALDIAEKWWKEGKLSYNWRGTKDVAFLAKALDKEAELEKAAGFEAELKSAKEEVSNLSSKPIASTCLAPY